MNDLISRQQAIRWVKTECNPYGKPTLDFESGKKVIEHLELMPSAQPDPEKYEYHYDHTDCIWYRPEARNRCPVTCSQYRDGWNDAMNYIFRDGKGYRPYKRGEEYGE
jgi:hypothetical protein